MSDTKRVIKNVRFSYANVWEARAMNQGDDPKYSTAVLIEKTNKEAIKAVEEGVKAALAAGREKFGAKFAGTSTKPLKTPLRDGDEERPDDPNYEGMMFFNASSKQRPQVVDKNVDPILDQDEFYSGCWGAVSVNFYPFDTNGNKGVAAGLNNVMKSRDGEKLSGGSTAAQDFGEMEFEEEESLD